MDTQKILIALQPIFSVLWDIFLTIVLPGATGWLALKITQTLKINDAAKTAEIDQRLRDALHKAALNGLKISLGNQTGQVAGDIARSLRLDNSPLINAVSYVVDNNPEAVAKFNLGPDQLVPIVLSKLPDVLQQIAKKE